MATPHPGQWTLLLNASTCELCTTDPAVHAAVVANRTTGAWKVLYFTGVRSFRWDPLNPAQITGPQALPPWPGAPFGAPDFFCSGRYLFEGDRPVITNAPSTVYYGTTFSLNTSMSISAIRLIRLGATTHAQDMDQRSVGLAFTQTNPNNGPTWSVTAPANANVAPPGLYMLFVLRGKAASLSGQTAIPSVARIVQVRRPPQ